MTSEYVQPYLYAMALEIAERVFDLTATHNSPKLDKSINRHEAASAVLDIVRARMPTIVALAANDQWKTWAVANGFGTILPRGEIITLGHEARCAQKGYQGAVDIICSTLSGDYHGAE